MFPPREKLSHAEIYAPAAATSIGAPYAFTAVNQSGALNIYCCYCVCGVRCLRAICLRQLSFSLH